MISLISKIAYAIFTLSMRAILFLLRRLIKWQSDKPKIAEPESKKSQPAAPTPPPAQSAQAPRPQPAPPSAPASPPAPQQPVSSSPQFVYVPPPPPSTEPAPLLREDHSILMTVGSQFIAPHPYAAEFEDSIARFRLMKMQEYFFDLATPETPAEMQPMPLAPQEHDPLPQPDGALWVATTSAIFKAPDTIPTRVPR